MTDPTPDPKMPVAQRGPSRAIKIALAVSLMLNLAVVGVVAGAWIKGRSPERATLVRDLGFGPFTEALSDDDRAALRRSFISQMPDMRDARRAMRSDLADFLAVLRADPFDPAALQTVFERQNTRMSDRLELGQRLMFERVTAMTPEARAAFADRLEQSLVRRPDRDRRGNDRDD